MQLAEADVPMCGSCQAWLYDAESIAVRRCYGCRQPPPRHRVETTVITPYFWIADTVLSNWWRCYVQMRGRDRCVSLTSVREQPQYWRFFRDDGNDGLIIGPTDLAGAQVAAERWLTAHGAIPS